MYIVWDYTISNLHFTILFIASNSRSFCSGVPTVIRNLSSSCGNLKYRTNIPAADNALKTASAGLALHCASTKFVWLSGTPRPIARKAAVVDYQHKKGRIILIGIVCQNRAQSHGTYKFLLNALLYPQL